MYINSKNKQLQLEPLRGIITQGEKLADTVTFALPNVYGNLTLSSLDWSIRAASEKNTLATASLTVSVMEDKCLLSWEVSSDFTAVSGALSLMLVGTDGDGKIVIKFPGDSPIWVRDSETGEYSPPEDAIENALNGLQSAEEALQNAIEALQSIGVNLKILGWYSTLEALQSGVTNPSPGDIYGVGDPTVLYVWTGSAWTQLPGVFVQSSGYNPQLLDNAYFVGGGSQQGGGQLPVNQRGETSYTSTGYGIDRWLAVGSGISVSISDQCLEVSHTGTTSGELQQRLPLTGMQNGVYTFSVLTPENLYAVSGNLDFSSSEFSFSKQLPNLSYIDVHMKTADKESGFFTVRWRSVNPNSVSIIAAKLELGPRSTLARLVDGEWVLNDPPPNFQQELAKCQRYQWVATSTGVSKWIGSGVTGGTNIGQGFLPTPVPLRTNPTFSGTGLGYWKGVSPIVGISARIQCIATEGGIKLSFSCEESKQIPFFLINRNGTCIFDANL